MSTNDIAIKLENVSKSFLIPTEHKNSIKSYFVNPFHKPEKKRFDALKDISFEVKKGEFFGIIGRNGSGKSTLLKILAGIYQPDKGKVTVNGKIIPFLELGVGFNPELSGRENIFLNGTILGMSRKYLEKKFDEIVDFAEVREFIDVPLKNYSSGMQVRLAFAITTVADGDIYLMDEVLAVGDSNFQRKCINKFGQYRKSSKTIIIVSHDSNVVDKYCTKAIMLEDSIIKYSGKPPDILIKYQISNMDFLLQKSQKNFKHKSKRVNNLVQIKNFDLYDDQNEKRNVFFSKENIIVKIKLDISPDITSKNTPVNIGLRIGKSSGEYVFGLNTLMDKFKINKNKGTVQFVIENTPLLTGTYSININCFGSNENVIYDYVAEIAKFEIFNKEPEDQYRGIINLKHSWK